VRQCLESGWVSSSGKFVNLFEENIARYVGSKYAVACVNGTAALHVALLVAGVGPQDEVIVPTVTFIAPVNAVRYVGAEPVFMDCDDYLGIDAQKTGEFIRKECRYKKGRLFNKRTQRLVKAILPVHVFGHPVNIEPLMDLAKKFDLKVIEDATESLGSYYTSSKFANKRTGSIGDMGCLSFNGNKIITSGGGGMVVTDNKKFAQQIRYLTTQAKDDPLRFVHNRIGYNYRLTSIQAAVGIAQLEQLDKFVMIKRGNFREYARLLEEIQGLQLLGEPPYAHSNYWFYALMVESRAYGKSCVTLISYLRSKGIDVRPLWQLCHLQEPYRDSQAYRIEKAATMIKKVVNLPCSVGLSRADMHRVVTALKKYQS
jgi:aminotransferase in exopolysaccharide biosynthesis